MSEKTPPTPEGFDFAEIEAEEDTQNGEGIGRVTFLVLVIILNLITNKLALSSEAANIILGCVLFIIFDYLIVFSRLEGIGILDYAKSLTIKISLFPSLFIILASAYAQDKEYFSIIFITSMIFFLIRNIALLIFNQAIGQRFEQKRQLIELRKTQASLSRKIAAQEEIDKLKSNIEELQNKIK